MGYPQGILIIGVMMSVVAGSIDSGFKLTSGITWEKLNVVGYESSVPLKYVIPVTHGDVFETDFRLPKFCDNTGDPRPRRETNGIAKGQPLFPLRLEDAYDRAINSSKVEGVKNGERDPCMEIGIFRGAYNQLNQQVGALKEGRGDTRAGNLTRSQRRVRGINFLGDFFNWCCNIITKSDIEPMYASQTKLQRDMEDLGFLESEDHKNLRNFSEEVRIYSEENGKMLMKEHERLTELARGFKKMAGISDTLSEEIVGFWELFGANLNLSRNFINTMAEGRIITDCKGKVIPAGLIKVGTLRRDLVRLSELLSGEGLELAIPVNQIELYYRGKISSCTITDADVGVTIKVPIRRRDRAWQVYEVKCLPFAWQNKTCRICSDQVLIARARGRTVVMEKGGRCSTDQGLCLIPRASDSGEISPNCFGKILNGESVKEIGEHCTTECVTNQNMRILQIDPARFLIVHPSEGLIVNCKGVREGLTHLPKIGALDVHLPCNCTLIRGADILIDVRFPCEKQLARALTITHVLPVSWSKFKSITINGDRQELVLKATNISEYIDEGLADMPHIHLRASTENDGDSWERQVRYHTPGHMYYLQKGESVLTLVTFAMVFVIIVRNPYLVGIGVNIQNQARATVGIKELEHTLGALYLAVSVSCAIYVMYRIIRRVILKCREKRGRTPGIEEGISKPDNMVSIMEDFGNRVLRDLQRHEGEEVPKD